MKQPQSSTFLRHFSVIILSLSLALPASPVWAQPAEDAPSFTPSTPKYRIFDLELKRHPKHPRNFLLPPFMSLILPGFDQWVEGQIPQAAFYTGVGLTGILLTAQFLEESPRERFNKERLILAGQLYSSAGGFSAYSSFRSAVRSQKPYGSFAFLNHEESTDQILLAPFRFSYLKRPTTYISLGVVAALTTAVAFAADEPWALSGEEALYGTAISYNAGTWEEAVFRGWLMPAQMEMYRSEFWSNTATATLFALAHAAPGRAAPVAQFIGGWYLGWVTQKDEWRVGEAAFIHFWYDVLVLNGIAYAHNGRNGSFRIPAMTIPF